MTTHSLMLALSMTLLAACSARGGDVSAQAAAEPRGETVRGEHESEHGTVAYRLHRPERAWPGGGGRPLLVMLHGCTQTADDFAAGTRMDRLADRHGFLVVYPEQAAGAHPQRCWNWYEPAHQRRGAGEPGQIASLVQALLRSEGVDPERVYIAGISAGGALAVTLAAHYPELFAAAGVHSALALGSASGIPDALVAMRSGPAADAGTVEQVLEAVGERGPIVPLILFHGAADAVVADANADRLEMQWTGAAERLAGGGQAAVRREEKRQAGGYAAVRRVTTVSGRTVVESWRVRQLGHAWSGGSGDGSYTDPAGPDASAELVRFLLAHSR
jgi:poly(hydroxyalkanoate) depolymerase family esterase